MRKLRSMVWQWIVDKLLSMKQNGVKKQTRVYMRILTCS